MNRTFGLATLLVVGALSTGCVDQRYLITSDPPGAMVLRNGVPIGPTPVDDQFVYYGNYHFTLVKDGYQTMDVDQQIPAPWYEYPPLDFVNEALNPFHIHDVRAFHYAMQPVEPPNKDDVIRRGQELRDRGRALLPPQPTPEPAPALALDGPPPAPPLGAPSAVAPDNP